MAKLQLPIGEGKPVPSMWDWLHQHAAVMSSLVWEHPSDGPQQFTHWSNGLIDDLDAAFERAWRGTPTQLKDPPPNIIPQGDHDFVTTGLDLEHAWALYRDLVAWSLALEVSGQFGWSVTSLSADALALLFDSRETFVHATSPDVYVFAFDQGTTIPAPPDVSLAFLAAQDLIADSAVATVGRVLQWATHLAHYRGGFETGNMNNYWQYRGYVPLSRVFAGTAPLDGSGSVRHWTAGCHGTAGVLHSLLRVVNVPARKVLVAGHALVQFPGLQRYLSHADDPYNDLWRSSKTLATDLLIDQARFDTWFTNQLPEVQNANIGRQVLELALSDLSDQLLRLYCIDQALGNAQASGDVAQLFARIYTVAQLEAMGLWKRMDARLAALGGCSKLPPA